MSDTPTQASTHIRLWKQNLNKSRSTQEDLINSDLDKHYDIMLLQEPYINSYGNTKATRDWQVVYLTFRLSDLSLLWAVILIIGNRYKCLA